MSHEERRRHPRISCRFHAELYILFPEETFRPVPYMCQVCDVSEVGMKVQVSNLPHDQYRLLLSSIRFARVVARGDDRKAKIYSRIVWIGARKDSQGRPFHELGLCFEERDRNSADDIQFLVERARATESAPNEADSPHPTEPLEDE